jgi:acetyltransferase-like isoleucine patch superfamily enzyme
VDWTRGDHLSPADRERLRAAGVDASSLDARTWRTVVDERLPSWWHDQGNRLYLADEATLPAPVVEQLTLIPVRDVVVVVGSALRTLSSLLVGGDGATVFVDAGCELTAGDLYCGGGSRIVLHGPLVATRSAVVDARNGGSIVAGPEQLWAAGVYVATDDMHRLEDRRTGERINPFGADVRLGRHVWLCREAVVTGHADVGDGAVVGMRAIVRGQKVPAHCAVVGAPARVVREGIAWSYEDLP